MNFIKQLVQKSEDTITVIARTESTIQTRKSNPSRRNHHQIFVKLALIIYIKVLFIMPKAVEDTIILPCVLTA